MKNIAIILLLTVQCIICAAGNVRTDYSKLSGYVRQLVMNDSGNYTRNGRDRTLMAFVKTVSGDDGILKKNGCTVHARMGDVYVVEIPLHNISELSSIDDVMRIEAGRHCNVMLDTVYYNVDVKGAREGLGITKAFTGRGVVMGIMDVGFDLTNPTFYSSDMNEYRIRAFWDMLSPVKDEQLCVGSQYIGRDAVLGYRHSADNLIISHGTHTLGIAAGSGYDSGYTGIAPESDICIVNNVVTEDTVLIAEEDRDKFTSATDALGFKYIFDYAGSRSMPCVISFSEGARQGFEEEDALFYEALASLTGRGKILVASAGNMGQNKTYMQKYEMENAAGTFVYCPYDEAYLCARSADDFEFLLQSYGNAVRPDTIVIGTEDIRAAENGEYSYTGEVCGTVFDIDIVHYKSSFDPSDNVYQIRIKCKGGAGVHVPLSLQLCGGGGKAEIYAQNCIFLGNDIDNSLRDAEEGHNILSPGSAPAVICVGATSYREGFVNYRGEYKTWNNGSDGELAPYSSTGPTTDGRMKPDVTAPGTNVISSYSSYYIEANPDAFDTQSDVSRYQYDGRTYSWNANTGTSMSSPVVGGIIALWLEADPNLSPDDVLQIMSETCSHHDTRIQYPNNIYGHGEINAYRGLLKILGMDGIEGIEEQTDDFRLSPKTGGFDIIFDSVYEGRVVVETYGAGGCLVSKDVIDGTMSVHHVTVPQGVYVVKVTHNGKSGTELVRVN